jgi:peptide methionine sulfoxide reductase msrA/msrB
MRAQSFSIVMVLLMFVFAGLGGCERKAPVAPESLPKPTAGQAHGADMQAESPTIKEANMVQVSVFNAQGKLVGPFETKKFVLPDAEWKKRLTADQYKVLRNKGTEAAFCGTLLDNKKHGVYTCAGCGLPLFASDSKFNSGTGWPSFFQPISKTNVLEEEDNAYGMRRTEILCARCDGHLGHVFPDGPKPTGLRFCLNSESLNFTENDKLASLADPLAAGAATQPAAGQTTSAQAPAKTATAIVAGGCFWCTEYAFEQIKAVSNVESGYTGGSAATANYKAVCGGDTGHAEAIKITYDPAKISYEKILDVFFDAHDPTTLNRQGADMGTQYRSAIFYADETQKKIAEAKIKELTEKKKFSKPIVTKLEPLGAFYMAEEYHQNYARAHPDQPYIQGSSKPKAEKVKKAHPDLVE